MRVLLALINLTSFTLKPTFANYIVNPNTVDPPAVCPCQYRYDPVCGSDNITYINRCILQCNNDVNRDKGYAPINEINSGECSSCICQNINFPVCTLDGEIYPNECELACENIKRIQNKVPIINLAYRTACFGPPCDCTNITSPVCGTDDVLYRNKCVLDCASLGTMYDDLPEIEFKNNDACLDGCLCPLTKDPICGSNGKIYDNLCQLDCENKNLNCSKSPKITVADKSICEKCTCIDLYDPVCGSDGKTYPNSCEINCEAKRQNNIDLKVVSNGTCSKCYCTDEFVPVCGSNLQTYENECKLRCANSFVNSMYRIDLFNYGACAPLGCDCSHCSNGYNPVCDDTGNTYWNSCWLECNCICYKNITQISISLTKEEACYI